MSGWFIEELGGPFECLLLTNQTKPCPLFTDHGQNILYKHGLGDGCELLLFGEAGRHLWLARADPVIQFVFFPNTQWPTMTQRTHSTAVSSSPLLWWNSPPHPGPPRVRSPPSRPRMMDRSTACPTRVSNLPNP